MDFGLSQAGHQIAFIPVHPGLSPAKKHGRRWTGVFGDENETNLKEKILFVFDAFFVAHFLAPQNTKKEVQPQSAQKSPKKKAGLWLLRFQIQKHGGIRLPPCFPSLRAQPLRDVYFTVTFSGSLMAKVTGLAARILMVVSAVAAAAAVPTAAPMAAPPRA